MLLGERNQNRYRERLGILLVNMSSMLLCLLLRIIPLFWINFFDSEIGNAVQIFYTCGICCRKKLSLQCRVILSHRRVRRTSPSFARDNIQQGCWEFSGISCLSLYLTKKQTQPPWC